MLSSLLMTFGSRVEGALEGGSRADLGGDLGHRDLGDTALASPAGFVDADPESFVQCFGPCRQFQGGVSELASPKPHARRYQTMLRPSWCRELT